jgi:acyl-CoA synthetase (AMP-forming)/AMP-acid ligase II
VEISSWKSTISIEHSAKMRVNKKLVLYKVPKSVEFRESLPTSAIGKVLRKILRAEEEAKKKD